MIGTTIQKRILLVFLLATVLSVICWNSLRSREPSFQSKPLSYWLHQYRVNLIAGGDEEKIALREAANGAIRRIGTNAIPELLRMLRQKDSALEIQWRELIHRQKLIKIHSKPAWVRNAEAVLGFEILGADAAGAVPALIQTFDQPGSLSSQTGAADALAGIGPSANAAVPTLVRGTTNSSASVRAHAANALGHINSSPTVVVPTLIGCLTDPSHGVRAMAARSLGKYGANARQAIPALSQLLKDNDRGVQFDANQALKNIRGDEGSYPHK